mgnify:CR=1 FL=1
MNRSLVVGCWSLAKIRLRQRPAGSKSSWIRCFDAPQSITDNRFDLRNLAAFQHGEELVNQVCVPEARLRFYPHGVFGLFVGLGHFVGAGGAQGVVDVDDLQDAGQERNFFFVRPSG